MIRPCLLALASCVALLAHSNAYATGYNVPLVLAMPTGALGYGGALMHSGWEGHTYLAPTLTECEILLNQHAATHNADYDSCPDSFTIRPCTQRGMFEISAPGNGGTGGHGGSVTATITVPARYVQDLGELRRRYQVPQYEDEVQKLAIDK